MSFPKTFWLTSKGVERLLGIDRSKVRRMKKAGELPFITDARGVAWFPRKDIEEMAKAKGRIVGVPPGPVAAKAFAFFAQGKTWQEVLIALGQLNIAQPVEVVRKLHEQFLDQDTRPATGMPSRSPKSLSRAELDENKEALEMDARVHDVSEWQHEQTNAARHAQAQQDRDQREWEASQRRRANELARNIVTRPPLPKAMSSEEDPALLSEKLAVLMHLLAQ